MPKADWRDYAVLYDIPEMKKAVHRFRRYMQWRRALCNRILRRIADASNP